MIDFCKTVNAKDGKVEINTGQALLNLEGIALAYASVYNTVIQLPGKTEVALVALTGMAKTQIAIMEQSETIDYNFGRVFEYQKRCAEEDAKEAAEKVDN